MSDKLKYNLTASDKNNFIAEYRKRGSHIFLFSMVLFLYVCLILPTHWTTGKEIIISILQFLGLTVLMVIVGLLPALISSFFRKVSANSSGVHIFDINNKPIYNLIYPTDTFYKTQDIDHIFLEKETSKKKSKEQVYISVKLSLKSSENITLFRFKGPFTLQNKDEAKMLLEKIGKVLKVNIRNDLQHYA